MAESGEEVVRGAALPSSAPGPAAGDLEEVGDDGNGWPKLTTRR